MTDRETILTEALESILANTERGAIQHIGHDGLTAYEALAKAVADCAEAALKATAPGPFGLAEVMTRLVAGQPV